MRLRKRSLKPYSVKSRTTMTEADGTTYETWSAGEMLQADVQPTGGKVAVEMYGLRVAYMLTAYAELGAVVKETDGVCLYVSADSDPDYKVVAVRRWSHMAIDLEAIRP